MQIEGAVEPADIDGGAQIRTRDISARARRRPHFRRARNFDPLFKAVRRAPAAARPCSAAMVLGSAAVEPSEVKLLVLPYD